jgi:hypothetical protein
VLFADGHVKAMKLGAINGKRAANNANTLSYFSVEAD